MTEFEKNKAIGDKGEEIIKNIISKYEKECQRVINNYIFKTEDGKTCQIDHIVIRKNGIFVIETKNYSGNIIGNEEQKEWIEQIEEKIYKFYNPIKQNRVHVIKLFEILGNQIPIYSIVVFTNGDLSGVYSDNVYTPETFEKRVFQKKDNYLTEITVQSIYEQLKLSNMKITEEEYIKIRKKQDKETKIEEVIKTKTEKKQQKPENEAKIQETEKREKKTEDCTNENNNEEIQNWTKNLTEKSLWILAYCFAIVIIAICLAFK